MVLLDANRSVSATRLGRRWAVPCERVGLQNCNIVRGVVEPSSRARWRWSQQGCSRNPKEAIPLRRIIIRDDAGEPTDRQTRQSGNLNNCPATKVLAEQSRNRGNVAPGEARRPHLSWRVGSSITAVSERPLNSHEPTVARVGLIGRSDPTSLRSLVL
jgi:hypothetical protein